MTSQLLFYGEAAAVSPERHSALSVEPAGFAFSRGTNSVPLTTVEFTRAVREYPVVFAVGAEGVRLPAAVLGLRDRENLFIDSGGQWNAGYIPAFVRRYPFVFAASEDGNTFTVCIDEGFAGCNREGRGERLFDDEGARTPYLEGVLAFLQEYQAQYLRTRQFCDRLLELELLEPMQANIALTSGEQIALGGFEVVSRDRLKALAPEVVAALLEEDALELIFGHLSSMETFGTMVDRHAAQSGDAA